MSWEIMREDTLPCPCGKSTYTAQLLSDDWGRSEERWEMDCPECKLNYRLDEKQVFRSGEWIALFSWVKK